MPGSRTGEITRLGPVLADAAKLIRDARPGIQFVTPVATPALRPIIEEQLVSVGVRDDFLLLDGDSEIAMIAADLVLLASGTAALESALLGKPTIAAYRVAKVTEWILVAMGIMKLRHYTLPNLMTETPLIPEFMQDNAKPAAIAEAVIAMLDDPERRRFISGEFAKLRSKLARDADQRAADTVVELAES